MFAAFLHWAYLDADVQVSFPDIHFSFAAAGNIGFVWKYKGIFSRYIKVLFPEILGFFAETLGSFAEIKDFCAEIKVLWRHF